MRIIFLFSFLLIYSCSSDRSSQNASKQAESIKSTDFKKEKVLTAGEVKDFYSSISGTDSPALQDETMNLMTKSDLNKVSTGDPLVEISLYCTKKEFSKAFELAGKSFSRYQKIPAYWNLIANCHLEQGSSRKALLFYNKALEVSTNYVPALNNIGVLYSRQGDDQKALVAFERANRQGKFAKTPRYNLARIYLRYGLAESALPLFQGLLGEFPKDTDLLNSVANCYFVMSDYQRAYSYFKQLSPKNFSRAEIGLNFAVTLYKLGKKSEAAKIFDSISKPGSNELKNYYSSIATQLGVK